MTKDHSQELERITVPNEVMRQIGVDICNLLEVDGFNHLVVCIDYLMKWSEAKPFKDNSASAVAHSCMKSCIAMVT